MEHGHAGHDHGHGHDHGRVHGRARRRQVGLHGGGGDGGDGGGHALARDGQRRLLFVMVFGAVVLVAELVAGLLANSLALLSDAVHMSTDVASLLLAYAAARIATWAPSAAKSYGWYRAEVVAAFLNALALWVVAGYFVLEAWERLRAPPDVNGPLVLVVGAVGLAANLVMAFVLHRGTGGGLNVRAAYAHVLSDALGSVAAVVAGAGVWLYDARWLDPATTLVISALIILWTFRLTRESLHVLLEGTPASVRPEDVRAAIAEVPGVRGVHDLHVWSLTTGVNNLSAHVMVEDPARGPALVKQIRERLLRDHDLAHVTIEIEAVDDPDCVRCD